MESFELITRIMHNNNITISREGLPYIVYKNNGTEPE